jgi:hypothetical protein
VRAGTTKCNTISQYGCSTFDALATEVLQEEEEEEEGGGGEEEGEEDEEEEEEEEEPNDAVQSCMSRVE